MLVGGRRKVPRLFDGGRAAAKAAKNRGCLSGVPVRSCSDEKIEVERDSDWVRRVRMPAGAVLRDGVVTFLH